jgi:hypothetical protein
MMFATANYFLIDIHLGDKIVRTNKISINFQELVLLHPNIFRISQENS